MSTFTFSRRKTARTYSLESRDSLTTTTTTVVTRESTVQFQASSTFVRLLGLNKEQHCTCLNNGSIVKSSVCPFIFDLKRAEVKGPILQFQSTIFDKDDVRKLLLTLNKACGDSGLKEELLSKTFDVWWPNLEESLKAIKEETSEEEKTSTDKNFRNEMLEEILELSRTNQKLLRSPEILFPPEYFEFIIRERIDRETSEKDRGLIEEQRHVTMELKHRIMQIRDLLEIYRNDKKYIDDEFYMNMRRLIDLFQHQQILSDQINTIVR